MVGNEQIKKLMSTPMSRKDFLKYMGVALLSVMGVGNIITALLNSQQKPAARPLNPGETKRGFGNGKYGV